MPCAQKAMDPAGQLSDASWLPHVGWQVGFVSAEAFVQVATSLVGHDQVACNVPHVCCVHCGVPGLALPLGQDATLPAGQVVAPSCEPHVGSQLGVETDESPLGQEQI